MKKYLRIATICFFCAAVFFATAYFYLIIALSPGQQEASKPQDNIPYYDAPDNCTLLFYMQSGNKITISLDFEHQVSYIIYIEKDYDSLDNYANYSEKYDFTVDYNLLSLLIDRLGGADITLSGETLRYTGTQICDILKDGASKEFSYGVILSLCEKIGKRGFSQDDFVFLAENAGSALPVPTFILWQDYIPAVFSNAVFVNWEN